MNRIDVGIVGESLPQSSLSWEELALAEPWLEIVRVLNVGPMPRPAQIEALGSKRVLESRRNLLVSAPTNGGKSLIGLLILLEAVRRGRRAVLLEPLRAIAREKFNELHSLQLRLSELLGQAIEVSISTGDYRLDSEMFSSPPPNKGEIVIATPERFEAITRNPDFDKWLTSIGAVCVDEAHLIGAPRRGVTLEYIVTSLLCLPTPPRLVLLSATIGATDRALEWLSPCDLIHVRERYPSLHQVVMEVDGEEDVNEIVCSFVRDVMHEDTSSSFLIFVYQTRSAELLAEQLRVALNEDPKSSTVHAYHSQMNSVQRQSVRDSFASGKSRCVIATTALGLGVNLPASHVIVRDNTFFGIGLLSAGDIVQMMGRAGRGEKTGHAVVIVRPTDSWKSDELGQTLKQQTFPDFVSSLERAQNRSAYVSDRTRIVAIATNVAALLSRRDVLGMSLDELERFFERSLAGSELAQSVSSSCQWLSDPTRALVFLDEFKRYRLTSLGLAATRAILPLDIAAGFGQMIRDLLTIDPSDVLLAKWTPLDYLLVLNMVSKDRPKLRLFSETLVEQVDAWMEQSPNLVPVIYREWIVGDEVNSRAIEVFGSLGIAASTKGEAVTWARKNAYLAMLGAIVIFERGQGKGVEDLERQWKLRNLEGIEERWRDNLIWLLSGLAKILDVRCFYYHLNVDCSASTERVQYVKRLFQRMCRQTFDLRDHLSYCSPLGPVLRSLRSALPVTAGVQVGKTTIRRLEAAGISNVRQLAQLGSDELVELGVRRDFAKQIYSYVRRRMQ
jgi:replicative superfamily II helicase